MIQPAAMMALVQSSPVEQSETQRESGLIVQERSSGVLRGILLKLGAINHNDYDDGLPCPVEGDVLLYLRSYAIGNGLELVQFKFDNVLGWETSG